MNFISFLLMIFPNPTEAAGADHLIHSSTRVSGCSGVLPLPLPHSSVFLAPLALVRLCD